VRAILAAAVLFAGCGQAGSPAPPGWRTVTVQIRGPGRVLSLPPAIDCPGICAAAFPPGTSVTIIAAPPEDGSFREWAGACRGSTGCMFELISDTGVLASFDPM
jgi:hypothetical protein